MFAAVCDCFHGERTLGCCAHRVAAVVMLRQLLRHQPYVARHPRARMAAAEQENIENCPPGDESDASGASSDGGLDTDEMAEELPAGNSNSNSNRS